MKHHIFRPLFVVAVLVVIVLLLRFLVVPQDFGIGERGYMYGWHRRGNEDDWKAFKVKYKTAEYCKDCHTANYEALRQSPHAVIQCENCHGPALDHPSEPARLTIDRSREQCLRCHFPLPYPTSARADIRGVDPALHNPGIECALCHNPHRPDLDGPLKTTGSTL